MKAAEDAGFEVIVTTDRRIRYQQNLAVRHIAMVVLTGSTKWRRVRQHVALIAAAIDGATPGSYTEVEIHFESKHGLA